MKELKDTLWKAADKLRGSLSANQYKDVILGLVFLKYFSDAYDERREAIRAELTDQGYDEEQIADIIDDRATCRFQLTDSLVSSSAAFASARDQLLPLLMSGKVHVRDAERMVGEAI